MFLLKKYGIFEPVCNGFSLSAPLLILGAGLIYGIEFN